MKCGYVKEASPQGTSTQGVLIASDCAWYKQPHPKADLLVEFDGFLKGFYLMLVLSGNVLFHESLLELFGHPQHLDIAHPFSQVFYLHVKLLKLPGRERGEDGRERGEDGRERGEDGRERGEDGRKNVNHSPKYTVILTNHVHEFPS